MVDGDSNRCVMWVVVGSTIPQGVIGYSIII